MHSLALTGKLVRNLIDDFAESLTRIHMMRIFDVKDEKCVNSKQKPFATFVNQALGEI